MGREVERRPTLNQRGKNRLAIASATDTFSTYNHQPSSKVTEVHVQPECVSWKEANKESTCETPFSTAVSSWPLSNIDQILKVHNDKRASFSQLEIGPKYVLSLRREVNNRSGGTGQKKGRIQGFWRLKCLTLSQAVFSWKWRS
jgi:hypothetical protein